MHRPVLIRQSTPSFRSAWSDVGGYISTGRVAEVDVRGLAAAQFFR